MSDATTISILGAGWLGEPLGAALVKAGFIVKGATTSPEKLDRLSSQGMRAYLLKVSDRLEGSQVQDFFQTDILFINLPPGRKNPNVEQRFPRQVQLILEAAEKQGVSRYFFVSSTSVYGDVKGVVTEISKTNAGSGSGKALLKAEQYLRDQLGERLTILRLAGLVGGERRPGRWFAGKQDLSGGNLPVNMVHRKDCMAIIKDLIRREQRGQLFNICADEHPVKRDFYTHQAIKDGLEPPTYLKTDESGGKIVSNDLVKNVLHYKFQYPDPMDF